MSIRTRTDQFENFASLKGNSFYMRYALPCLFFIFAAVGLRAQNAVPEGVETEMDSVIRRATSDYFVVIAGESSDYILLKQAVQDLSKKTGIMYNDNNLMYDRKLGLIWPPDTSAGADIYAGSYFMRRYGMDNKGINCLSLEMRDWYFNVPADQKSLRMIIVAGIYDHADKKGAEARLKEIKKYCPTAYLRKTPIYMGCIH